MGKPKTNRAGDPNRALKMDACQTPAYAVGPLLPFLKPEWTLWESAAGEGLLAAAMRKGGFTVLETDILTGQNFFQTMPPYGVDAQVTNPPYSVKFHWLARSYQLNIPFALLMPVEVLGAKSAQRLFRKHGLEVIFLDDRVDFKMPNQGWNGLGAKFPVAWFTNGLHIGKDMTFALMHKPGKQRLAELAAGVEQLVLL